MLRYLVRRVLFMILVLIAVSILTFWIFVKLPSTNPVLRIAGKHPSPQQIALITRNLGLDRPIWIQYWKFAQGLIPWPGLFLNQQVYYSWQNSLPVETAIAQRLPVTAMLALGAAALWVLMGIPIGIVSAIRRGTVADRAGMLFALVGVSAPTFFMALVLLFVFHFAWNLLPSSAFSPGESVITATLHGQYVLPWFSLAFTSAAFYSRMVRGNLIETMSEDYIRTARAKGLSESKVIFRHGLRGALTPVVTMFGLDVAFLMGGAVVTETIFQLPGIGQYAINSLYAADFPPVMGVTVIAALFIVVANLLVDVAYAWLDPRVRYT